MCNNRKLTRDLLLEYDVNIMPPRPRAAGLGMVYPWENIMLDTLTKQLFIIASSSGYNGTENDFKTQFGSYLQSKQVLFGTIDIFPETGELNKLYFDLEEKILYYWENEYKPVNALLIENTILNGGTAADEITENG